MSAAAAALDVGAFTTAEAPRDITAAVSDDRNAVVGLQAVNTVKRNTQGLLAEIENNRSHQMTVTVTLDDCTQGTLYGSAGDSGCSVAFTLAPSNSAPVDIETGANRGTEVAYTVTATGQDGFTGQITRTVTAESGNVANQVEISKIQDFRGRPTEGDWAIKRVRVDSTDHPLDRVEYAVETADGQQVASRIDGGLTGTRYERTGRGNTPGVIISPDGGHTVGDGEPYTLIIKAYDTAGNFDRKSRAE